MERFRPVDLARAVGLSAQAIRNYEAQGILPPAERRANGYRSYGRRHEEALRAFLALVPAVGRGPAGDLMRALVQGDVDTVLTLLDRSHAELLRERATLASVVAAVGDLTSAASPIELDGPLRIGELADELRVRPATLRAWEAAGVLAPGRDRRTGARRYEADDVRDALVAYHLRRGGHGLAHVAEVVAQVRTAGGVEALHETLDAWQGRLTARGRALVAAAAELDLLLD